MIASYLRVPVKVAFAILILLGGTCTWQTNQALAQEEVFSKMASREETSCGCGTKNSSSCECQAKRGSRVKGRFARGRRCGCGNGFGDSCACNGSYKFPVPPLYTYHWIGLYSHQRMTDYHSPWRFPPIRPYVDEIHIPLTDTPLQNSRTVYPISATQPLRFQKQIPSSTKQGSLFLQSMQEVYSQP